MFTRITLIYPPTFENHWGAIRPPIGLGYLSEMLQQHDIAHQVIDMSLGYAVPHVAQKIAAFGTDLIGVSMTSLFHQAIYAMLREFKARFPKIPIIAGGPHISTIREQVLHDCGAIDYAVTLEGEHTLIELCQGTPPEQIGGLLFRLSPNDVVSPGKVAYTGDRPFIADLDEVTFPKYEYFELSKYVAREVGVITSRGCPYACTFCPVKTTIGRTCRFRQAQPIVDELEYWHDRGYRDILILDDNFAMHQDRVYAICDEIEKRKLDGFRFRCGNGIRADHVDEALLRRMFTAGFRFLSFGVESANDHILKGIKKGEQLASIEHAVKTACEIGYDVTLFFIVGLPGETAQDVENSLRFAQQYPVFDAKFYNLIPFPNTEIYHWIENHNYFLHTPEQYLNQASHWDTEPLFETPEFPKAERMRMLKKAHGVRKQIRMAAMRRKLVRLGPLSSVAAAVFVHDEIQDLLLHNRQIRRVTETAFRLVSGHET